MDVLRAGDLLCCGQCANNYLESNVKVPWDDLRYIFGEIMYGGHIVEDWDRRLASAYLFRYFNETLLEGFEMFPGFPTPPTGASHKQVRHPDRPEQQATERLAKPGARSCSDSFTCCDAHAVKSVCSMLSI